MKIILTFLFCILPVLLANQGFLHAQDPTWNLQTQGGSPSMVTGLVAGESGIIISGVFADSLVIGSDKRYTKGGFDVFAAKVSNEGKMVWLDTFGGPSDDHAGGIALHNGSIYLGGLTMDSARFANRFFEPGGSVFIKRYSLDGQIQWSKILNFKGIATLDDIKGINNGRIVAVGSFRGIIDINGQKRLSGKRTAAYTLIFDEEGNVLHFLISEGNGNHRNIAVAVDQHNNLYQLTTGQTGSFIIDQAHGPMNIETNALIISKLNTDLGLVWANMVGSFDFIEGINIVTDFYGNVYAGLNFSGTLFSGDFTLSSSSELDAALFKYTSNGKLEDAVAATNPGYLRLMNMVVYQKDQLLLTGYYFNEFNILNHSIADPEEKGRSSFLIQISEGKEVTWSADLEHHLFSYGSAIATGENGSILFSGGAFFGFPGNKNTENEAPVISSMLTKFGGCNQLLAGIEISSGLCPGDTIILKTTEGLRRYLWNGEEGSDKLVVSEPGEYQLRVTDWRGCEATSKIELEYSPATEVFLGKDATLIPGEELWLGYEGFASDFFWADGFGMSTRLVQYRKDAEYDEFVLFLKEKNKCWGAGHILVKYNHIFRDEAVDLSANLRAYPVPFRERLNWAFENPDQFTFSVMLYDEKGLIVFNERRSGENIMETGYINTYHLSEGSYLLNVTTARGVAVRKVVKLK